MKLKPTGYYILVKMEEVEITSEGGIVLATANEHQREQNGHDVGTIVSIGPTAFCGFQGCDAETPDGRAAQWGCAVGDKVEFNRYEGKVPRYEEFQDYRIIQDAHIIGVIGE